MSRLLLGTMVTVSLLSAQDATLSSRAVGVLEQRCFTCHGAGPAQSGLRLNSREAILQGGTRGPAIIAGDVAGSRMVQAIRRTGELSMPPGPKLPADEIATIEQWIAAGAAWPKVTSTIATPAQTWWSFQKPVRPAVPVIVGSAGKDQWVRTPIDAFIAKKLGEERLKPAPEADRRTLIRRASLDLHGLPPTAEQIEKFVNDPDPNAYEKLIDELLASPRYGEKWGRHWLDLARYGDTSGFEQDPYALYAWRYRDYVIDSFNADKPYDRFVKEQIAGDELYPDDPAAMTGTGFYTVGPNRDMLYKVEDTNRLETLTDWVDTTGSVFLGLSVRCARCHDHKFDPISQKDYYAMRAIFEPAEKTRVFLQYDPARGYDLAEVARQVRLYEISDQLSAILPPGPGRAGTADKAATAAGTKSVAAATDAGNNAPAPAVRGGGLNVAPEDEPKLRALEQQLVQMFRNYKPGPFAPGIHDVGRESATRAWLPGHNGSPPEAVPPGFLSVLGGASVPVPPIDALSTGNRTALANWIATMDNPLTARVMVNRIWQYHFGQGLVASTSDFGHRGGLPSHPELLDWLTTEFTDNGWSIKKLHKLIMMSNVYRQSSEVSKEATAHDAGNIYLSHFNRRRLMPEEIRDTMLQASGVLNLKMAGRPVVPPVAKEELYGLSGNGMWNVTADTTEHTRRSIYMLARRTFRPAMFETFDAPEGIQSCERRTESNTAPQSLTLLNGQWTVQESQRLAEKLMSDAGAGETISEDELIGKAWLAVYGHAPRADDVSGAQTFLERQTAELGSRKAAAAELVRVLFNTNEFLYVE